MSEITRSILLGWSQDALIDKLLELQNNAVQQTDTILSRRNRLLTEENESFRRQLQELDSLKSDFYNLRGQHSRNEIELTESQNVNHHLKQEMASLQQQIESFKQFQSTFDETQHQIQQLQSQNTSLVEELDRRKKEEAMQSQAGMTVNALTKEVDSLKSENKNLQDDLLREERLHCSKYQEIWSKLNEYQTKYNELLQRYSSMESFVEEFCEDANQSDDDNDVVMEQLTKWTHLLKHKQERITMEIEDRVRDGLEAMTRELDCNRREMESVRQEMAANTASTVVHEVMYSAMAISNENMVEQALSKVASEREHLEVVRGEIASESAKMEDHRKRMESQVTQLNGQKLLISNLNQTIEDLLAKIEEYEHRIHRLTVQLKQLSMINRAQQECNTDFNVQQIQTLSTNLMEKEVECDQLQSNVKSKEKDLAAMTTTIADLEGTTAAQQQELTTLREKVGDLETECTRFDAEYTSLQRENQTLKQKVVSTEAAMREIENDNNLLRNEMDRATKQFNALKQKEYNFKLQEQALKEQYQANYKKFNTEYQSLRKKISALESGETTLKNEVEQYHSAMMKHKEQSRGLHLKYKQLEKEYEEIQRVLEERDRKYTAIQSANDRMKQRLEREAMPTIARYKVKVEELTKQVMRITAERDQMEQMNMSMDNLDQMAGVRMDGSGRESADRMEIERMRQEIESLNDQLYEGSNKRRQLRELFPKLEAEAQFKLRKSKQKLVAARELAFGTFRVMEEQRHFVQQNEALRRQFEYLKRKVQANQENHMAARLTGK